jgi:uncharacterized membrane protein YhhN
MSILALIFLLAFILISIIHIIFVYKRLKKFQYYSLPSIFLILILYYVSSIPIKEINFFIIIALGLGFLGNFFLIFYEEESYWLNGIISLIVGQLSYIIAFLQEIVEFESFIIWKLLLIVPVFIVTLVIYIRIHGKTEEFQIPVYMYLGVIFLMNFFAILRFPSSLGLSFFMVWIGSFIFQVYYGIILIDVFDQKIPHTGLFVLITYIIAQFLITQGDIFGVIF